MSLEMKESTLAQNKEAPKQETTASPETATSEKAALPKIPWWIPAAGAVAIAAVIFFGIRARVNAEANVTTATREAAVPIVRVAHPSLDEGAKEISLPGNTVAYIDAPIYARTNG